MLLVTMLCIQLLELIPVLVVKELIQFMLKLDHYQTLVQVQILQCVKMILIQFMLLELPLIHGLPVQEFHYLHSNGTNSSVRISPPSGIYTYTVTGTDSYQCQNTDQVQVEVFQLPNANIYPKPGYSTSICDGNITIVYGSAGDGNSVYSWDGGQSTQEITVNPTQTTTYTTTITDYLGCSNTASIVITVTDNNYSIDLGADIDLCVDDTFALDPNVVGCDGLIELNNETFDPISYSGTGNGSVGNTGFWNNVQGSSQMWQTNANGTSSGSTGPSSANSSDGYIYLEAQMVVGAV